MAGAVLLTCSRTRHPLDAPPRPNSLGGPEGAGLSERGGVRTGGGGWAEGAPARRHTLSCACVAMTGGCLRRSSARLAASSSLCCCSLIFSRSAARCLSRSSRIRAIRASSSSLASSAAARSRSSSVKEIVRNISVPEDKQGRISGQASRTFSLFHLKLLRFALGPFRCLLAHKFLLARLENHGTALRLFFFNLCPCCCFLSLVFGAAFL